MNRINLNYRKRLLEEAMNVVDFRDWKAQRKFQAAYRANVAAEEREVDLDELLDGESRG